MRRKQYSPLQWGCGIALGVLLAVLAVNVAIFGCCAGGVVGIGGAGVAGAALMDTGADTTARQAGEVQKLPTARGTGRR